MYPRKEVFAVHVAACALIISAPALADVPPGCVPGPLGTQFADVTGDGRADAIVINSDRVTVRRSDGTTFLPNESWTANPYYGMMSTYFADVSADQISDAIAVNPARITVRRPLGLNAGQFGPNESWTSGPYYGNVGGSRGTQFADVTGDGATDAIVINTGGVTVRRSDTNQFLANETWTTNPYYGTVGTYFADVTGDGRADAIVVNGNMVTVRRSDGTRFLTNESWTNEPYYGDYYPICLN